MSLLAESRTLVLPIRRITGRARLAGAMLLALAAGAGADGFLRTRSLPYAACRAGTSIVMPGHRHPGVQLAGRNLRGAQLRGADLSDAGLRGANLGGSCLAEAGLERADLREAGLFMADLTAARLGGADLRRANLRGAHLFGADLSTARLEGADLTAACFDAGTTWPRGFDPRAHGAFYLPEPPPMPPVEPY